MKTDVIVIGAGHAGCEAALASSRMEIKTILLTTNFNNIADMPCNPSIGGSAKGIVVREIDALGGEMGDNADKTFLQIKLLNRKKGPGVRSLRAQSDKEKYGKEMYKTLNKQKNLIMLEDLATEILVENGKIKGVNTNNNGLIIAKKVIITTGTYLDSYIMRGSEKFSGGPHGENTDKNLSESLKRFLNFVRVWRNR